MLCCVGYVYMYVCMYIRIRFADWRLFAPWNGTDNGIDDGISDDGIDNNNDNDNTGIDDDNDGIGDDRIDDGDDNNGINNNGIRLFLYIVTARMIPRLKN